MEISIKSNLEPFLKNNLDILFVGHNPATGSSENRHYFSVKQHLWNQLFDSGLITEEVDKSNADEVVFGGNKINFHNWSFGITDLIIEIADSDPRKIKPTKEDYERLKQTIIKFSPKVVILLHGKVTKKFLRYLNKPTVSANHGQIGKVVENCPTMFYAIAFPHGNNIPSIEKVEKYRNVKNYLIRHEEKKG